MEVKIRAVTLIPANAIANPAWKALAATDADLVILASHLPVANVSEINI